MELPCIIIAVEDLLFRSKIKETAKWLGTSPVEVKNYEQLAEHSKKRNPKLIIIDLNYVKLGPIESVVKLKKSLGLSSTLVIGFLSHVQLQLRDEALAKGYDYVFSKSLFTQKLADLIQEAAKQSQII